jgi:hypothetical protein
VACVASTRRRGGGGGRRRCVRGVCVSVCVCVCGVRAWVGWVSRWTTRADDFATTSWSAPDGVTAAASPSVCCSAWRGRGRLRVGVFCVTGCGELSNPPGALVRGCRRMQCLDPCPCVCLVD